MVQEQYPQEKASLRVRRLLLPFHHSHRNVQILISRRVAQLSTAPSQNSALYSFARSRQSGHPRRGDASAPPSGMSRSAIIIGRH